jgi:hypothetical protein
MDKITFTKTAAPAWLLAMWKEIDDKTFGKGFDCFAENAVCNLGVADWHGREAIRDNLRQFIDKGFTAHHDALYRASRCRGVLGQPLAEGVSWQGWHEIQRSEHQARDTYNDAFLLYGRKGSDQGQALDRLGRSDRFLGLYPAG